MYRRILGPLYDNEKENWRILTNKEIYASVKKPSIRMVMIKNLVVKSTMFPHRNIHKTHNQTDHVLIDRRWHSSVLDVRSFRGADCDTDHYLVIAKVRVRLAVGKQAAQRFDRQRFNLRKLNGQRLGNNIRLRLQTCLQLWKI